MFYLIKLTLMDTQEANTPYALGNVFGVGISSQIFYSKCCIGRVSPQYASQYVVPGVPFGMCSTRKNCIGGPLAVC